MSESLATRHPTVVRQITDALARERLSWKFIAGSNIWVRDFLPLQVGSRFVKFAYRGYGESAHGSIDTNKELRVPPDTWEWFEEYGAIQRSTLRLDGGNVQRDGETAIISEIVFEHNPRYTRTQILDQLEKALEARIVIVPVEPDDDIGHTDGMLHQIPGTKQVLVHDYSAGTRAYQRYHRKLMLALEDAGLNPFPLPWEYPSRPRLTERAFRRRFPHADTFNPAWGYYGNFSVIGHLVLVPVFGIAMDETVLNMLMAYFPGFTIAPVDCSDLSMEGGLVNCVTMNYRIPGKPKTA